MSSFKCCKNFSLKINFSESNFLEVYAVVHYTASKMVETIQAKLALRISYISFFHFLHKSDFSVVRVLSYQVSKSAIGSTVMATSFKYELIRHGLAM